MRRVVTLLGVAALVAAVMVPAAAAGQELERHRDVPTKKTREGDRLIMPSTPNPYLSFLPDASKADYATWNEYLRAGGIQRATAHRPGPGPGLRFGETEPASSTGGNDTVATADFVAGWGTGPGEVAGATLVGTAPQLPGTTFVLFPAEEDGSLGTATETGLTDGDTATASATIGDGAWGSAGAGTGDFDFYVVRNVSAGEALVIDVDTPVPFDDLDPFIAVWDASGVPVAFNDDDGSSFDSFLAFIAPAAGDYFVSVAGFGAFIPVDPTTPGSPSVTGELGSEGGYDISIELIVPDIDMFSFSADAGDIIGATVKGAGLRLVLFEDTGTELVGSSLDLSFIYPARSPLPGGGNASVGYVIDTPGDYVLATITSGPYHIEASLHRPRKETRFNASQKLFIDFDGATLDISIFGAPPGTFVSLSPLSAFLGDWGLNASDEDAVIDAILASVEESISADIRTVGNNGDFDTSGVHGDFDIEILNSRDHPDPWGDPWVSRVVVGGTIPEAGIPTIGIAQSIDVGDFNSEETALVLLDILSSPDPTVANSLNNFPIDPSSSIISLIGAAVGNIVVHEAGHFMSNWHTDQFNAQANIMDQGGNLPNTIGVGPDGIWGTADDVDVDLGLDVYVPNEGFTGIEDTLQSIAFSLSTGPPRPSR